MFFIIADSPIVFYVTACRGNTVLTVFEGDIRDRDLLTKACRGTSTVFHIAAIIDVHDYMEDSEIYGINVKGLKMKCDTSC